MKHFQLVGNRPDHHHALASLAKEAFSCKEATAGL